MSSKMKNILFRADSSSIIGTGHIMRDLVLATQYKNSNIIFAVQDFDGNITKIDINYYIEHQILPSIKPILDEIEKQNQLTKWF